MSKKKNDGFKILRLMMIGGVVGLVSGIGFRFINLQSGILNLSIEYSLVCQLAIILIFFLPTVVWVKKAKQHFKQIDETVDDENDQHRAYADKLLFRAQLFNRLFTVLSFIAVGIAIDFSIPDILLHLLISIFIFSVSIYLGAKHDVRIVRLIQANDPMKKGDPLSFKFNQDYFSSLDEGERVQIYQASYHTYLFMQYVLMGLLTLSIGFKIYFDFGNGLIIMIGLAWLLQTGAYSYYTKKFNENINR